MTGRRCCERATRQPTAQTSVALLPATDVTTALAPPGRGSRAARHERPLQTCAHGVWAFAVLEVPTAIAVAPNAATSLITTPCRFGQCDATDVQSAFGAVWPWPDAGPTPARVDAANEAPTRAARATGRVSTRSE